MFVIHRRSELRACKEDLAIAKANPKIHFLLDTEIVDAYGKDHLEGLTLVNKATGEKRDLPVRACSVVYVGMQWCTYAVVWV